MTSWRSALRQAREAQGLTRAELARRADISADTVASYELGRRPAKRPTLVKLVTALGLDPPARDSVLRDAGFLLTENGALGWMKERRGTTSLLDEEVRNYPWPCLVLNDRFEITSWNCAAIRVGEKDFAGMSAHERNMMAVAADPHFRDRALNWSEIVSHLASFLKSNMPDLAQASSFNEYFAAVVNDIATRFSQSLPRLMQAWSEAPLWQEGSRNIYHPVWQTGGTRLRFDAVVTTWSDFDALYINDWQPADASTWEWLASQPRETAPTRAGSADVHEATAWRVGEQHADAHPWYILLRLAREQSGLTRAGLATLARCSTSTVDKWEAGRRKPEREGILRLARAMQLDGASTNVILTTAGFDAEPSDYAMWLSGQPRRAAPARYKDRNYAALEQGGARVSGVVRGSGEPAASRRSAPPRRPRVRAGAVTVRRAASPVATVSARTAPVTVRGRRAGRGRPAGAGRAEPRRFFAIRDRQTSGTAQAVLCVQSRVVPVVSPCRCGLHSSLFAGTRRSFPCRLAPSRHGVVAQESLTG